MKLNPAEVSMPTTVPSDSRVGQLLARGDVDPVAVIVGFASDQGVVRNGGRAGAAQAPDRIRHFFYRTTPPAYHYDAFKNLVKRTVDLGNVVITSKLEEDQALLGDVLAPYLRRGVIVVVLGGGHETAFGHFLGYVNAGMQVEVVNIDSHADVRELRSGLGHSGSPFRQMIELYPQFCRRYTVAGLLPHCNSVQHLKYLSDSGGRYFWRDEVGVEGLTRLIANGGRKMLSFDIDVVDQASAPGVSAPAVGGLDVESWLHAFREAGRQAGVNSIDLVEVNPGVDIDDRTSRLAGISLWNFFVGLTERGLVGEFPGDQTEI